MTPTVYPKQIIEAQKATFDSGFKVMAQLQDQSEKSFQTLLDQTAAWMPEEGRKAVQDWLGMYRKGRQEFKKMVDDGFHMVEELLTGTEAETEKTAPKRTAEKSKAGGKSEPAEKSEKTATPASEKKATSTKK